MKKISLTSWIFIAMAAGIAIGHFFPEFGKDTAFLGTIFLRLIKSIIAPLLFATLVVGIAGSGSAKAMGRIGLKALIYFNVTTIGALALALLSVNYFKPGVGVSLEGAGKAERQRVRAMMQTPQHQDARIQLSLFGGGDHPVVARLRGLAVEELTPIEALTILFELKQQAQDTEAPARSTQ